MVCPLLRDTVSPNMSIEFSVHPRGLPGVRHGVIYSMHNDVDPSLAKCMDKNRVLSSTCVASQRCTTPPWWTLSRVCVRVRLYEVTSQSGAVRAERRTLGAHVAKSCTTHKTRGNPPGRASPHGRDPVVVSNILYEMAENGHHAASYATSPQKSDPGTIPYKLNQVSKNAHYAIKVD